ncbi:uncharacterized protein F4807DRAFT_462779 [Annulohypoxylon truncatum]|uniref:uncharacterized protein n=1 Tax=Annulohypoxylon truncatum TaxID=327061 RepID=UPI0020081F9A|nr:uncharacterized protein F4807DRAFT_462779 [Annulohypoxylon truncatum]KAI1207328.1 hypothetical protein F4807DRAFT_462779 [Annulohypoxylon truncatum]
MKISIIAIAAAVAPGAIADFWLTYMARDVPGAPKLVGGTNEGAVFTKDQQITCSDMRSTIYSDADDVSGHRIGMRTVPGNIVQPPIYRDPLEVVEFNTGMGKPGHHTIYKDRGYAMFDVDGKKTGQCHLNRSQAFQLKCDDNGDTVYLEGSTMFFCESDLNVVLD